MAKQKPSAHLRRGELDVVILELTHDELSAIPKDQRGFYLSLGQIMNEVAIMQSLLLRSLHGIRGPRPAQEAALGMALFLTRASCGRLVEAHATINSHSNGRLLDQLWRALPDSEAAREVRANAEAARVRLNKGLGSGGSVMRLVRNKLAYHLDQNVLDEAFLRMPRDLELADFHTGLRGTTFFGVADTVAAVAVAELTGAADVLSGVADMADAVMRAVRDLQDFADGYLLAFYLVHLGEERLDSAESVRLRGLPEVETASLGFYMASKAIRRSGFRQD